MRRTLADSKGVGNKKGERRSYLREVMNLSRWQYYGRKFLDGCRARTKTAKKEKRKVLPSHSQLQLRFRFLFQFQWCRCRHTPDPRVVFCKIEYVVNNVSWR